MNGPTRSKAFDLPASAGRGRAAADAWPDELDQFVDSEPLAWSRKVRPAKPSAPVDPPKPAPSAAEPAAHEPAAAEPAAAPPEIAPDAGSADERAKSSPPVHVGGPSTAEAGVPLWTESSDDDIEEPVAEGDGRSDRLDAFSRRLSEELSRKSDAPAAPIVEEQAADEASEDVADPPAFEPSAEFSPAAPPDAALDDLEPPTTPSTEPPEPGGDVAEGADDEPPWRRALADATGSGRTAKSPRAAFAMSRATPTLKPTPPKAPIVPVPPKSATPTETPEARLERELDDAIGAIVTGRPAGAEPDRDSLLAVPADEDESATLAVDPGDRTVVVPQRSDVAAAAEDQGPDALGVDEPPANAPTGAASGAAKPLAAALGGVIGGKRPKAIPTFKFKRRPEPDAEPFPRAPADMDDPLAAAYLSQEEDSAAIRSAPVTSELEADEGYFGSEFDREVGGDPFFDDAADDDPAAALPPALSRGRRARSRPSSRSAGIAAVVVGAGAIALLGVIGFNVFAGSGTPVSEPRLIRADATDVKVRPNTPTISAEPDIATRAQVGETGTLVVPDDVRLSSVRRASPAPEEGIVSRPVRTVVVRPDGTLLPADTNVTTRTVSPGAVSSSTVSAPPASSAATNPFGENGASAPAIDADRSAAGAASVRPVDDVARTINAADPFAATDAEAGAAPGLDDGTAFEGSERIATGIVPTPRRRPTPPPRSATTTVASAAPTALGTGSASAASSAPAATAGPNAPWAIQVSSQRTRADAEQSYRDLQRRYGAILGGIEPRIVAADVPGRGRFYRVRVPANSQGEAARLCQRLKAAGGDCFIGRN